MHLSSKGQIMEQGWVSGLGLHVDTTLLYIFLVRLEIQMSKKPFNSQIFPVFPGIVHIMHARLFGPCYGHSQAQQAEIGKYNQFQCTVEEITC